MAIVSTDIKYQLSGGAANSDPDAALGGAISTTEIVDATLSNLFDSVSGAESAAGDIEYRCFYVLNNHGTLTLEAAKVWINANTPSTDTDAEIGIGSSGVNGTEQTVANESTAPAAVTFDPAAGVGNAITIGNIPPGEHMAIWVKRTVTAAASAFNNDSVGITVEGDTQA